MALLQRILPSRRSYNQFVANETMEDYALRYTAAGARKFPASRVANAAFGATSFLALEALGGSITLQYGTTNAVAAIISVGLLIALISTPIAYAAVRAGVDIDLLTRAAGFGYIGSTITSLIYASFTFIFFAIEASIFTDMLFVTTGIPVWLGYIISSVAIIPLVAYGITFISRFQAWTQPAWLILNFTPICYFMFQPALLQGWGQFMGSYGKPGLSLLPFGFCASIIVSLIAQVGEQVDYLRFLKEPEPGQRLRWWAALLATGPGWIIPGIIKMLAGSVFAVLAVRSGFSSTAGHPVTMYRLAYEQFLPPVPAMVAAALLITVAQTKINVTNAYAGSIAWSNFFSRLTHRHPGRFIWLIFNVGIALALMELGVYQQIQPILTLFAVLACAWVGAICADLLLVKTHSARLREIEFKRAHLYDLNPVGIGAMATGVMMGLAAVLGIFGLFSHAVAPFLALMTAFMLVPILAFLTRGKFYLARKPRRVMDKTAKITCKVCDNPFEARDIAYCPAYAAPICSLCCTLDSRCRDACKPHARYSVQLLALLQASLPGRSSRWIDPVLLRFLGVFGIAGVIIALILAAVYWQASSQHLQDHDVIANAFLRSFFCLLLVTGIFAWLQVLARESRSAAEEESRRQTKLLLAEIKAHQKTDAMLARARQVAEAANLAKTRFVVGVSHELRTPLNAVLGYAQLLEVDPTIPKDKRNSIGIIRRSGEHLHGLIEGLMDISKIEAGRIEIERREIELRTFLEQIVGMFQLQAAAKEIGFEFHCPENLPTSVFTDETRLRQILINLLTNAVKFTARGSVVFAVRLPGQVMEFEVRDTGPGIASENLTRIFEPFERVVQVPQSNMAGIGLGLTITKLLVEILGGQITVISELGQGSIFRVQLRLPAASPAALAVPPTQRIIGYKGPRRTIILAEDNAVHRALLHDALAPLGFTLLAVPDGPSCLRMAHDNDADLFLLDLSMPAIGEPDIDGLEVAAKLRSGRHKETPIILLSAHVPELRTQTDRVTTYNAALAKPVDIGKLFTLIGKYLKVTWIFSNETDTPELFHLPTEATHVAFQPYVKQLLFLANIGFIRGIKETLATVQSELPAAQALISTLMAQADALDIRALRLTLETLDE